jgi:hypothetical protein
MIISIRSLVAQSEQCLTTDWTTGVRSPTEAEDFSFNLCVQTGCRAHPASYTIRDADLSPLFSAEVQKEQELYTLSPKASPWREAGHFLPACIYLFHTRRTLPQAACHCVLSEQVQLSSIAANSLTRYLLTNR